MANDISEKAALWIWAVFMALGLGFLISLMLDYSHFLGDIPEKYGEEERQYTYKNKCYSDDQGNIYIVMPDGKGRPVADSKQAATECGADNYNLNEFIKDKRDLNAQEGMWRAAFLVVVISVMQFIVGCCGLWVLLRNLKSTNKAITAADRTANTAELAERAWVYLVLSVEHDKDYPVDNIYTQINKSNFIIKSRVVNYGKTPATDFLGNITVSNGQRLLESLPDIREAVIGGDSVGLTPIPDMPQRHGFYSAVILRNGSVSCNWSFNDVRGGRFKGCVKYEIATNAKGLVVLKPVESTRITKYEPEKSQAHS